MFDMSERPTGIERGIEAARRNRLPRLALLVLLALSILLGALLAGIRGGSIILPETAANAARLAIFWTLIVSVFVAWRRRITLGEMLVIVAGYAIAMGIAR